MSIILVKRFTAVYFYYLNSNNSAFHFFNSNPLIENQFHLLKWLILLFSKKIYKTPFCFQNGVLYHPINFLLTFHLNNNEH